MALIAVFSSPACVLVQAKTIPNGSLLMFSRLHRRVPFPCGSEESLEREEKHSPRSENRSHGNRFSVSPSYVTSVGTRVCRHFHSTVSVDTDMVSVDIVLPLPL